MTTRHLPREKGQTCPDCGLDIGTVMPLDAVAAVRSFPRRYRGLLTGFDDDEDADALVRRRPDPSTPSALETAARVADVLDATSPIIRRMTVEDEPSLDLPGTQGRDSPRPANDRPIQEVLGEIDTACADLASTTEMVDDDDWLRVGHFPGGDRTVLDMARNAVHEGSHNLREIERIMRQVRGRPAAEPD
jgi:hypothetical protein